MYPFWPPDQVLQHEKCNGTYGAVEAEIEDERGISTSKVRAGHQGTNRHLQPVVPLWRCQVQLWFLLLAVGSKLGMIKQELGNWGPFSLAPLHKALLSSAPVWWSWQLYGCCAVCMAQRVTPMWNSGRATSPVVIWVLGKHNSGIISNLMSACEFSSAVWAL